MMVETILESSQDFHCMSNGSLPQWKRELLQRRALRRPPPPPPPPPAPPAPPPPPDDEELRYGPGIVKRLKSRYLSLALRDAPRRRPSVLRRAASLEHMLDAPAAAPPPPPAAPAPRRDAVKRARSVDALSRLEPEPPRAAPPPPPAPPAPRAPRPPRRPQPLLREAERPPPDVVRAALRKFEPSARRGAARPSARSSTPEAARPGSPGELDVSGIAGEDAARLVSRAALDGIARAGSSVRYAFPAPRRAPHLPRAPRRVGVIRPMPAPPLDRSASCEPAPASPPPPDDKERRAAAPAALVEPIPRAPPSPEPPAQSPPPPRARSPSPAPRNPILEPKIDVPSKPEIAPKPEFSPRLELAPKPELSPKPERRTKADGLAKIEEPPKPEPMPRWEPVPKIVIEPAKRISSTIESKPKPEVTTPVVAENKVLTNGYARRAASPPPPARSPPPPARSPPPPTASPPPLATARAPRGRRPPPAATSVVFNFVSRADVPDYIENDGVVLRAARRAAFKATEPGVVVLDARAAAGGAGDAGEEDEDDAGGSGEEGAGRVSPLSVTFVNDNVLINGKSSMPARHDPDRISKLKLQFDESLTRTHEYPSEASLCEESPPASPRAPPAPPAAAPATPATPAPPSHQHPQAQALHNNTHMAALLARWRRVPDVTFV